MPIVGLSLLAWLSCAWGEDEPRRGEAAAKQAAGSRQDAPIPAAPPPQEAQPAPAAAPTWPPECVRTGERVIGALARDDTGVAEQFHAFYRAFRCPELQLARAFGCLVQFQDRAEDLTNPGPEEISACWRDPATVPTDPRRGGAARPRR